MSACSNTIRALSRVPANKTLLPFLYQTPTIQQWKPAAQHIARRSISRYRPKDEPAAAEVPFETEESLPPALDDAQGPRRTTITGSERAAFEKLYRRFNARGNRQQDKDHEVEIDAIADEYWEPDEEEQPSASLDKIFDEALIKGSVVARERNRSGLEQLRSRKPREDLQSMAKHLLERTRPVIQKNKAMRPQRKGETSDQAAQLKSLRLRERSRVDDLLTSAKTDRELWETLHSEVFAQVRQLDLDGTAPKPKKLKYAPDPKILFSNYPHHLLTALATLRKNFPASPLPLSILPTIKSFGRSSYALGATTALYNQLLRTAWLQQSSYAQIASLLTDMHNGAVEFNADTLTLLDQVLKEHTLARSGQLGKGMQMVYGLDQFNQGIKELTRWRAAVAERVGVEDGRREKGTVPVPRRRRAVDDLNVNQHVPFAERKGAAAEHPRARPVKDGALSEAPKQAILHDIDPGVEFGFLSEEDTDAATSVPDQVGSSSVEQSETADGDAPADVKQALHNGSNNAI
jgi:hypothetical protein